MEEVRFDFMGQGASCEQIDGTEGASDASQLNNCYPTSPVTERNAEANREAHIQGREGHKGLDKNPGIWGGAHESPHSHKNLVETFSSVT